MYQVLHVPIDGTSSEKGKAPFMLWCDKEANINDFKVFGEVVYAHIPKEKRKKLDRKAEKGFFVGYS